MKTNPYSLAVGLVIVAVGVVWMLDNLIGLDVPWDWVVPVMLVAFGAYVACARSVGPSPSQFERDDAPRVP